MIWIEDHSIDELPKIILKHPRKARPQQRKAGKDGLPFPAQQSDRFRPGASLSPVTC
jgi:hypothetical protein